MTPELALILAGGASGAAGGFFAPEGQEVSSFQDFGIDIPGLLRQGLGDIDTLKTAAFDLGQTPISLRSSFAQQPPVFTGGGLPQPIGVTGIDPALADPSLLSIAGPLDIGGNILRSTMRHGGGGPARLPLSPSTPSASTPFGASSEGDTTQAVGAARLLLEELLDMQAQQGGKGLFT